MHPKAHRFGLGCGLPHSNRDAPRYKQVRPDTRDHCVRSLRGGQKQCRRQISHPSSGTRRGAAQKPFLPAKPLALPCRSSTASPPRGSRPRAISITRRMNPASSSAAGSSSGGPVRASPVVPAKPPLWRAVVNRPSAFRATSILGDQHSGRRHFGRLAEPPSADPDPRRLRGILCRHGSWSLPLRILAVFAGIAMDRPRAPGYEARMITRTRAFARPRRRALRA